MINPPASMLPVAKAAAPGAALRKDDLHKAAQQFEAVFLRQLIGSMRQAHLAEDALGSSAVDNFREMADARTADSMASLRQFGIADMVERQLSNVSKIK